MLNEWNSFIPVSEHNWGHTLGTICWGNVAVKVPITPKIFLPCQISIALNKMPQKFLCLAKTATFYDFSKSSLVFERPSEPETGASDVIPRHRQWGSDPISVNIISSQRDETFVKAWSGKFFSPFSSLAFSWFRFLRHSTHDQSERRKFQLHFFATFVA